MTCLLAVQGDCEPGSDPGYAVNPGTGSSKVKSNACYIRHTVPTSLLVPRPQQTREPQLTVMFSTFDDRPGSSGGHIAWQGWFSNLVLSVGIVPLDSRAITWKGGNLFLTDMLFSGFTSRALRAQWTGVFLTGALSSRSSHVVMVTVTARALAGLVGSIFYGGFNGITLQNLLGLI